MVQASKGTYCIKMITGLDEMYCTRLNICLKNSTRSQSHEDGLQHIYIAKHVKEMWVIQREGGIGVAMGVDIWKGAHVQ
jgi:hypothetical protein